MKVQNKIALILACLALFWMCVSLPFAFYVVRHPGPVPRSISVPLLFLLILTIVGGSIVLSRAARKQVRVETVEESRIRRLRATKGLKAGLVVWILILLNDLRMLAQHTDPWTDAIPGLTVVVLLIAASWISLRRLKKLETTAPSPNDDRTSQ